MHVAGTFLVLHLLVSLSAHLIGVKVKIVSDSTDLFLQIQSGLEEPL